MIQALIANWQSKTHPPDRSVTSPVGRRAAGDQAAGAVNRNADDQSNGVFNSEERRILLMLLPLIALSISPPIVLFVLHWFYPELIFIDPMP